MSLRMYFGLGGESSPSAQPDSTSPSREKSKEKKRKSTEDLPKPIPAPSGEKQDLGFYFSSPNKVMGVRHKKRGGETAGPAGGDHGSAVRAKAESDQQGEEEAQPQRDDNNTSGMQSGRKKLLSPFQKKFQPRHGSEVRASAKLLSKHHRRKTAVDQFGLAANTGATAASLQQASAQRRSFNVFRSTGMPSSGNSHAVSASADAAAFKPVEQATPWQFITGNAPNSHISPFAGGPGYWPKDAVSDALRVRVKGRFINANPKIKLSEAQAKRGDSVYNDPSVLVSMMKGEAVAVNSTAALQASIEDKRPMWPPTVAPKQHQDKLPSEERLPPPAPPERDTFVPHTDVNTTARMSSSLASPRPESSRSHVALGSPTDEVSLLKRMLPSSGARSSSRMRTPRTSVSGGDIQRTVTSESVDTIDSSIFNGMDYFGGLDRIKAESGKVAHFRRKFQRLGFGNSRSMSAKESAQLTLINQLNLEYLSVRDMKYIIEKHGLSYSDCSGKVEFTERTRQALHIAAAITRGGTFKHAQSQRTLRRGRPSGVSGRNRGSSSLKRASTASVSGAGGRGGRHMHSSSVSSVDSRRSRSATRASRKSHASSVFKPSTTVVRERAGRSRRVLGVMMRETGRRPPPVPEVMETKRRTLKSSSSTNVSGSEHSNDEPEQPRVTALSARSKSVTNKRSKREKKKSGKQQSVAGTIEINSNKSRSRRLRGGRRSKEPKLSVRSSRALVVSQRKQSTLTEHFRHKPRFLAPLNAEFVLIPPPPICPVPTSGSKAEKAKQDVERAMMAIAELETIRFNLVDEKLRVVDSINDLKDDIRKADGKKDQVDLDLIDIDTIPQANEDNAAGMEEQKASSAGSGSYQDPSSTDFVRGGDGHAAAPEVRVGGPEQNKVMSMTTGRMWEVERH